MASRTPWSPGCPCHEPRLLSSPWTLWTVDLWAVGLGPPAFKADSTDHGGEPFPVRPARCLDTDIDSDFCWPSPTQRLAESRHFALDRRFCEWDGACNFALGPARTSKTASPSGPSSAGMVSIVSTEGGKKSQRKQKRRSQGLCRVQELSSRSRVLTASISCLSRCPRVPLKGREHVLVSRTSNCRTSLAGRRVSANGQCCFN